MTIIQILGLFLLLVVGGVGAYYIITKFFPEPMRTVSLAIVGVILLIVLIYALFPAAITQRLW